ncbi:TonB-dependent receptor [Sphingomonas lenta]|uniref:TonB-dependent receptor n=1 Tax=Sphingomonas lenta TaxID=1141887 RepID=A0A2A2SDM1_9SPHN|nr:TonB-dependent receptor [Sphingomonas lenta]PAX07313.1 TonB-dependent receptor [Sphingomonas lenta]
MRNMLFAGVAAVALIAPAAVSAQETTARIRGTVTANDQPVVGATVVATDVASGTRSQTTTEADGGFNFSGLRPGGPYTVEVTSPQGNTTVTDIFTVVQQEFQLPIDLTASATGAADAGAVGEDIVVTASSIAGAGTSSDGPQTVLTQADIRGVASVNRDIRDIQRRDPFASLDLSNNGERGGAVSFAGVNPRFNRFTINGVQVGDTFGLNQDASPTGRGPVPYDALGQVSVSIAPYDIRQGNFQGGVIDAVLLSGTNEFHGTGFYSQSRDELQGKRTKDDRLTVPNYLSETYGATIRGPIIPDKLFFMVSAERNTDPRPFGTQLQNIPRLTQSTIDQIVATATGTYNFDPGNILVINNRKDEKIVGRLDWNVTDGQRLSLSYINAFDTLDSQNNTSQSNATPQYGLESNAYALSQLLRAGIVQLNSDWTDNFSTEARFLYRSSERGQEPLRGRGFAQFGVCTEPTSVNTGGNNTATSCGTAPRVFFGPDISRQTNELFFDTWGGSLLARIELGDHEVRLLGEYNENRTFNNFLQNSLGNFYFDSLADYQNRRATQLTLRVPVNGQPNGAAADFKYGQFTLGFEDNWRITDNLNFTYGVRYDLFGMRDTPTLNPFFLQRYGFANTQTYKGLDNFQPRISFNWNSPYGVRLRGGVGVFGGGSPDIYLSNSFSNTVLSNQVVITRGLANAGIPAAVVSAALDNVTGQIPAAVANFVQSDTRQLANTITGALDPDFRLPSSLKATLSAEYDLFGFTVGADYLYTENIYSVIFTDQRAVRTGLRTPDGRPRYTSAAAGFGDQNYDILTTNATRGRSHIGVVRVNRDFDNGINIFGSYTLQDVKDVSNASSSTINSNYGNQIFGADPDLPAYGTSNDEITWQFKYAVGLNRAFFGDYRTIIQLFGETRAGRRYSFTMRDNTNTRSSVFGTILNQSQHLLYVPTGIDDARVSYDSTATRDSLESLIQNTSLKDYRGRVAGKNIARSRAFTRIDLHVEQEVPTGIGDSKVSLFADIENLPNLIDKDWGGLRQLGFPQSASVVNVQCLQAPVATGTAPTAAQTTANTSQPCAQYRYSTFTTPNEAVPQLDRSVYLIRVGARFSF